MIDVGYAVYVNDPEARQPAPPVAVFAYESDAIHWAGGRFAGRHRVEQIRWQEVEGSPEIDLSNPTGAMNT